MRRSLTASSLAVLLLVVITMQQFVLGFCECAQTYFTGDCACEEMAAAGHDCCSECPANNDGESADEIKEQLLDRRSPLLTPIVIRKKAAIECL